MLCAKSVISHFTALNNIDVTGSSEQNPNSITFGPNFENQNDDEKHETAQKDTSSRFFRWNAIFGLSFGNPFSNNFVDQQIEDSIDDTLVSDFSSSNTTLESESDQDASYEENRLLEGFDLYDEIPAEVLNSVDEQSDDDQSEKTITIIAEKEDLPGDLAFEIISQEEIAIAGGNQELDETIGNGVNRLKTYLNKEFEGLLNQDAEKDMLTAVNMPRVMVTIAKLEELHGRRCKELQEGVPCGSDVIYSSEFGKASVLVLSWSCKNNHRGIWRSSEVEGSSRNEGRGKMTCDESDGNESEEHNYFDQGIMRPKEGQKSSQNNLDSHSGASSNASVTTCLPSAELPVTSPTSCTAAVCIETQKESTPVAYKNKKRQKLEFSAIEVEQEQESEGSEASETIFGSTVNSDINRMRHISMNKQLGQISGNPFVEEGYNSESDIDSDGSDSKVNSKEMKAKVHKTMEDLYQTNIEDAEYKLANQNRVLVSLKKLQELKGKFCMQKLNNGQLCNEVLNFESDVKGCTVKLRWSCKNEHFGMWDSMKSSIITVIKTYNDHILGGDGRNDSPGFCARFCVYVTMELITNAVLHLEVLDKRDWWHINKYGKRRSHPYIAASYEMLGYFRDYH
eukprot:gene5778-11062_t